MSAELPSELFDHYTQISEADRLFQGSGELERLRTQDVLSRYLPKPPAVVLDIGGGPGVHALWLAKSQYDVHLMDVVPHHVEQALEASAAQPETPIASCRICDARQIEWPSSSADAALLLGPLYHLTERQDRLQALAEAHRVLRPGGILIVAAVSRYASLLDGLASDLVANPSFVEIVQQDLEDGQHRNPENNPRYFTTTFFHHPDELRDEIHEAGFQVSALIGVEGPAWVMEKLGGYMADASKRRLLLDLLRKVEEEPSLLGASAHFLGIGRK